MMNSVLYHGTDVCIYKPDWKLGSRNRDFGNCFYTTYSLKMAQDWAKKKSVQNPVVNGYVIDFKKIESGNLRIKRFVADAEWAEFIYNNRYKNKFQRPAYDIIIGPSADNGLKEHFAKIKTENKTFDEIAPLIEYRRYEDIQVCFCSDYAINLLRRIEV